MGYNAQDDEDDYDDPESTADDSDEIPETKDPAPQPNATDKPVDPFIRQYLSNKDQFSEKNPYLEAQKQVANNNTATGVASALAQLGHGLSRAQGSADLSGINAIAKNNDAPLRNLESSQDNDPNSERSKAFRKSLALVAPKIADVYGDSFEKITAADAPNIMKSVDLKAQLEQRAEASKDRMETSKSNAALRASVAESVASNKAKSTEDKMSKEDETSQGKIGKELNSLTTSGRNALGLASKAKVSTARLLDIVNNPQSTNQDLQSAYSDLNQIVSGTSTIGGSAHQSYNTLWNQLAETQQYLTGAPQAPLVPEIRKHVADVAKRMMGVSDDVIKQNTKMTQANHSGWIKRHPDEWQAMVNAANPEPAASGGPMAPAGAPQKPPVTQNGHTYNWNPATGKYE